MLKAIPEVIEITSGRSEITETESMIDKPQSIHMFVHPTGKSCLLIRFKCLRIQDNFLFLPISLELKIQYRFQSIINSLYIISKLTLSMYINAIYINHIYKLVVIYNKNYKLGSRTPYISITLLSLNLPQPYYCFCCCFKMSSVLLP